MQIDKGIALHVAQRRYLVHPLAVVPLVVRIPLITYPPCGKQGCFRCFDAVACHQYVNVRKQSTPRRWQIPHEIRSTLQQNDRRAYAFQSTFNTVHFPPHLMLLPFGQSHTRVKVGARTCRHVWQPTMVPVVQRQTSQQTGVTGLPQSRFPLCIGPGWRAFRRGPYGRQQIVAHCRDRSTKPSNNAMASLKFPYLKSKQSLPRTTFDRASKPAFPSTT